MGLKDFLKPTKWKIIIFLIICFIIFSKISLYDPIIRGYGTPSAGYPLSFNTVRSLGHPGGPAGPLVAETNYLNTAINLIIYYLISCLIIFGYKRVKK
jgi:hypothetical protein